MASIAEFEVRWRSADVESILDTVRRYPFPAVPEVEDGWDYGCDGAFLSDLCDYWSAGYDWRAAVDRLNQFPQFITRIQDIDIHFVHVRGEAATPRPLLLAHGWPGSHFEFWECIEKLAFPSRFGGDSADAFDVVVPSLPGFGFSSKPSRPIGQRATARIFNTLMTEALGYDTYLAQGGDWGAVVVSWLGYDHADHVRALHLNLMAFRPPGPPQTEEERAWTASSRAALDALGGYQHLQRTRPQSVAWLGAGNPVGQAAWIVERFHDWSDLRTRTFLEVYTADQLLTNIMIYVMTDSFTTGAWYYRGLVEERAAGAIPDRRVEVPTAFADYPGEPQVRSPPKSWVGRAYNLVRWRQMPRGGHFAAMEEPNLFVDDVREFGRELS